MSQLSILKSLVSSEFLMIRVRVILGIRQFSLVLLVFIMCCSGSSALREMLGELPVRSSKYCRSCVCFYNPTAVEVLESGICVGVFLFCGSGLLLLNITDGRTHFLVSSNRRCLCSALYQPASIQFETQLECLGIFTVWQFVIYKELRK